MADEPSASVPTEPAAAAAAPEPPAAAPEAPAGTPDAERTFTQAQVNAMLSNAKRELLGGEPDIAALRKKAKQFDDLEAASQTELERANARLAELERANTIAAERAQEALLRASVVAEAARKNVVDPEAAVALIDRTGLEFDEGGTPTNIAEAMDSLLAAKPYLVAATGGRPNGNADLGARGTAPAAGLTRDDLKGMSSAEIVKAHNEGRIAGAGAAKP